MQWWVRLGVHRTSEMWFDFGMCFWFSYLPHGLCVWRFAMPTLQGHRWAHMRRRFSKEAPVLIRDLWHGTEIVQNRGHGLRFVVWLPVAIIELRLLAQGPAALIAMNSILDCAPAYVLSFAGRSTCLARAVRTVLMGVPQSAWTIYDESSAIGSWRCGQGSVNQVGRSMVALDLSRLYLCGALQVFTNGRQ